MSVEMGMTHEEYRETIINFLGRVKKAVREATDFTGTWTTNKPSLRPAFGYIRPVGWRGLNHTKYTFEIDVLGPHSLESTAKRDEE